MADEIVCRICGTSLEDGPVKDHYELCPTHFNIERRAGRLKLLRSTPLPKKGRQAASGPVPNPQPVEAAGGDNNNGVPKPAEETPEPAKGMKSVLPSAANLSEGQKLGPACGPCKRSKIRCTHRLVLDDASNVVPSKKRKRDTGAQVSIADKQKDANNNDVSVVGVEAEAPPPAKRARKAQQKEGGAVSSEAVPSHHVGSVAGPAKIQTRGSLKRKREAEEPQADLDAAAAAGATTATAREETEQPPLKRSKRARKPTQSVDFVDPVVPASKAKQTVSSAVTPAAAPERRYPIPFPLDNLEGSALIAYHRIQSRRFETLVEEANTKWVAAMEALEAVKNHIDGWAEQWAKGV